MNILNDVGRLQRIKVRNGIQIAQASSLRSYSEMSSLKRDIDSSYKEIKSELERTYTRTSRRSVEDWINTIPVMKPVTFNKVQAMFHKDGIWALILAFVPHQEL